MLNFADRLPHALLVLGEPHSSLKGLLPELKGLLCEQSQVACGACVSCQLFESESGHPDLMTLLPEGKMGMIKIDTVRELIGFLEQSSLRGGLRIVVLVQADALNIASQNALLKSLEEPGAKTLIILLTDRIHLLLPTIKSRCQVLNMTNVVHAKLNELAEELVLPFDVLTLAQKWKDVSLEDCLRAQILILYDVLRMRLGGEVVSDLCFPDLHAQTQHLGFLQPEARLFKQYQEILVQIPLLHKQVALNMELMLCQSLIAWQALFFGGKSP
jgi:hypothetical protein